MDRLSKMVHLIPAVELLDALRFARHSRDWVLRLHGMFSYVPHYARIYVHPSQDDAEADTCSMLLGSMLAPTTLPMCPRCFGLEPGRLTLSLLVIHCQHHKRHPQSLKSTSDLSLAKKGDTYL